MTPFPTFAYAKSSYSMTLLRKILHNDKSVPVWCPQPCKGTIASVLLLPLPSELLNVSVYSLGPSMSKIAHLKLYVPMNMHQPIDIALSFVVSVFV